MSATETVTRECGKCYGTGYIEAYAGIANGQCFTCGGSGNVFTTVAKEKANKAAAARRAKKNEARKEATVSSRIATRKANGWTLQEHHEDTCLCGEWEDCTKEYGVAADWASA